MVQIIFLGILTVLGLFGLSKIGTISKTNMIVISIAFIMFAVIFSIFEDQNDLYKTKVSQINLDFGQGKEIVCNETNISNKTFNITSNSFVAKKESIYRGTIIPLKNCFQD